MDDLACRPDYPVVGSSPPEVIALQSDFRLPQTVLVTVDEQRVCEGEFAAAQLPKVIFEGDADGSHVAAKIHPSTNVLQRFRERGVDPLKEDFTQAPPLARSADIQIQVAGRSFLQVGGDDRFAAGLRFDHDSGDVPTAENGKANRPLAGLVVASS